MYPELLKPREGSREGKGFRCSSPGITRVWWSDGEGEEKTRYTGRISSNNESKKSMIPMCKAWIGSHKAGFKVCFGGQLWKGKGKIQTKVIKQFGKHTRYCE